MITIHNTTRGDKTIADGYTIPANGSKSVPMSVIDAAMKTAPVQSWVNAGRIAFAGGSVTMPSKTISGAASNDEVVPPAVKPADPAAAAAALFRGTDGEPAETEDAERARLTVEAQALNLTIASNWKIDTVRRKVAEARAAGDGG